MIPEIARDPVCRRPFHSWRATLFTTACVVLCVVRASAATYYVSTGGNNSNSGTQQSPWLTISYAAGRVNPGDIVRVQSGTYNERTPISRDGTSANWITFIGDGMPVCRGFDISSADYVRIIGFEITHINSSYSRAIDINGTCTNLLIEGNYIHHTYNAGAAIAQRSGTTSYVTIRNNRIDYVSYVPGVYTAGNGTGISPYPNGSSYWLVEYNTLTRCGDFINAYGHHHIIRNNSLTDYQDAYWTGSPIHSDMFQPGSDGMNCGARYHVYECNWTGDSRGPDSHFMLQQDTIQAGDTDMLVRGNVGFNFGSGAIGVISTDNVLTYNNTFFDFGNVAGVGSIFVAYDRNSNPSTGNLLMNTLIANQANRTGAIDIDTAGGSTAALSNNIGYLAGSHSSFLSTANPQFINTAARNFRLQASSPALNAGTHITTITSAAGSGTSFSVAAANRLNSGWGICDGDIITTGGRSTRVTAISGNTITVADSVTWTSGQPIYWGTDTTPDIGALPYGSQELTTATLSQAGSTYTVSTAGDTRGVWFYVDGVPTTWVSTAPYTATISTGTVTAKAYALWAQAIPVITATPGAQTVPPSPSGLSANPQ